MYGHLFKSVESTLYVHRKVENAEELIKWAKSNGFDTVMQPGDLHVTVAFSRESFDWTRIVPLTDKVEITQVKGLDRLGKDGEATVLKVHSPELEERWAYLIKAGASWDHQGYHPHITLSWNAPQVDIRAIREFPSRIILGPEVFETVKENWKDQVVEKSQK